MQSYDGVALDADAADFQRRFDREPFEFEHNLAGLDLFGLDALQTVAERSAVGDYFVTSGARSPGTPFYSVAHGIHTPHEALERLESGDLRVLLKRPEKYDPRFRALLDTLFERIVDLRGGLRGEKLVRLDGSVLVSSAATITPFHFDPEVSFFFQIEGDKVYHLYAPSVLTEPELERFYVKGIVDIGELRFDGRDRAREHVFTLRPNLGMHQPQNAPHWVETSHSRSISYVVSFETDATRARGRTRSFNHYLRKAGITPERVGADPGRDALKAGTMRAIVPARKRLRNALRKALGR